jgi:hypothetical protein
VGETEGIILEVGVDDGTRLGAPVGILLGSLDFEGAAEGDGLGASLGAPLGIELGAGEGNGVEVGQALGSADGPFVG